MTQLYLIRHAEAEGNLYRIAQGQDESLITDWGRLQIAALRERFAGVPVDAVYSSDLYRACVTAGALYLPKNLTLHRRRDLREICMGAWEKQTWGDLAREDPKLLHDFSAHPDRWRVPGAETAAQVRDRVLGAVREIAARHEGQTAAVFSHGCALRLLLGTLQGYSLAEIGQTPLGRNTAVSLLEWEGDSLRVVFRDDDSHLDALLADAQKKQSWSPNKLEPGLRFEAAALPAEAGFLRRCAGEGWADSGRAGDFDGGRALRAAEKRPTLTAKRGEEPVGILQLSPEREADGRRGWISLFCTERPLRRRGYGVQLLGQAVQYYRALGRETLCVAVPGQNQAGRSFFLEYGFRETGRRTADGRGVLEKDIAFHPLPGSTVLDETRTAPS